MPAADRRRRLSWPPFLPLLEQREGTVGDDDNADAKSYRDGYNKTKEPSKKVPQNQTTKSMDTIVPRIRPVSRLLLCLAASRATELAIRDMHWLLTVTCPQSGKACDAQGAMSKCLHHCFAGCSDHIGVSIQQQRKGCKSKVHVKNPSEAVGSPRIIHPSIQRLSLSHCWVFISRRRQM